VVCRVLWKERARVCTRRGLIVGPSAFVSRIMRGFIAKIVNISLEFCLSLNAFINLIFVNLSESKF